MGAIKRLGKRERKARLRAKLGAVDRHYSRFATLDNVGKVDPLDGCLTFSRSGKLVPARLVLEGTGSGLLEHGGLKSKSHYTGCAAARLTNFDRPTHDTIPKYGRKGQVIKLQAGVTSRQGAIISLHNSPKGSKASAANNRNNKRAYGLVERFSQPVPDTETSITSRKVPVNPKERVKSKPREITKVKFHTGAIRTLGNVKQEQMILFWENLLYDLEKVTSLWSK